MNIYTMHIYTLSNQYLLTAYSLSIHYLLRLYLYLLTIYTTSLTKSLSSGLVGAVYKYLDNIYTLNIYSISIHYLLTLYRTSVTKSVGWLVLWLFTNGRITPLIENNLPDCPRTAAAQYKWFPHSLSPEPGKCKCVCTIAEQFWYATVSKVPVPKHRKIGHWSGPHLLANLSSQLRGSKSYTTSILKSNKITSLGMMSELYCINELIYLVKIWECFL